MATFEISRAGSNYPTLARYELPLGAIFRNRTPIGELGPSTFVHIGVTHDTDAPVSVAVSNFALATARDLGRDVAMVGQAQFKQVFYPENNSSSVGMRYVDVGSIVVIDGETNSDGLPIAYGYLGRNDSGQCVAMNFAKMGEVKNFHSSSRATVVGVFGVTGTEV